MTEDYQQVATNEDDGDNDIRHDSTSTDMEYDAEFEVLVNAFLRDMDYSSTRQAVFNIVSVYLCVVVIVVIYFLLCVIYLTFSLM